MIFGWGKLIGVGAIVLAVGAASMWVVGLVKDSERLETVTKANLTLQKKIVTQRAEAAITDKISRDLNTFRAELDQRDNVLDEVTKMLLEQPGYEDYKIWRNTKHPDIINERLRAENCNVNVRLGLLRAGSCNSNISSPPEERE